MKVLVAVGMTGGHIIPGIAVAEELRVLNSEHHVVFAGTTRGRAAEIVGRAGYRYIPVPVRGWSGLGLRGKGLFPFFLAVSLLKALGAVRREKPCVIVGTGSYATLPFALSAVILSLPLVLLEQNVVPGYATKLLSLFAREVHLAYEESLRYLREPAKTFVTGNPIRSTSSPKARTSVLEGFGLLPGGTTVLVFGGSRGAHSINLAFAGGVKELARREELQFIVQTGGEDLELVESACADAGARAFVTPFIHEMTDAYECADLVVCRAGATTIAELTGMGLPSILVPYPFSTGGHQEKNALLLRDRGASVMVNDEHLTGDVLAGLILELLGDPGRMQSMRIRSLALGKKDAAARVARAVSRLGEKKCSGR